MKDVAAASGIGGLMRYDVSAIIQRSLSPYLEVFINSLDRVFLVKNPMTSPQAIPVVMNIMTTVNVTRKHAIA